MKQETLKELLKPPFDNASTNILNGDKKAIFSILPIAAYTDVRNWLLAALNEKWERDFGEPLRWVRLIKQGVNDRFVCKKCKVPRAKPTPFCPKCGQKLDPPEEKKQ